MHRGGRGRRFPAVSAGLVPCRMYAIPVSVYCMYAWGSKGQCVGGMPVSLCASLLYVCSGLVAWFIVYICWDVASPWPVCGFVRTFD